MAVTTIKSKAVEFLEHEYVVPDGPMAGTLINFDGWEWQEQILDDLLSSDRQYNSAIISTPRQQGKSLLLQSIGAYFFFAGGTNLKIYSIACDRDQAALVPDNVKKAIRMNPGLSNDVRIVRNEIENLVNGNKWIILSSDQASSLGISADVLLWDELGALPEHAWNLFYLLLPTTSARPDSLMVIASTVGDTDDGPLADFMRIGRQEENYGTYLYETSEIQSPLTSQEQMARDKELMPEAVYARHYRNVVMRGASFISDTDIEAMIRPVHESNNIRPIGAYIGNDWGLTKDKCAVTNLLALESDEFVFDKCEVFRGSRSSPVDLNDAAEVAENYYEAGWTFLMLFDKWQAMSTIQQFQKKYGEDVIQGFDFTNTNRKRLFKNIFTVIRGRRLIVFSDILRDCWKQSCSTCPRNLSCDECNAHDLLRELQGLMCDSDFNVTHGSRGDDIVVSVALGLFHAVQDDSNMGIVPQVLGTL
jgi:hypothetical protein